MTPDTQAGTPAALSSAATPPARRGKSRRWPWALGSALGLVAGAVGAWFWFPWPAPVDPPMPRDITDTAVLSAVRQARQQVLDKPGSAAAWGRLAMILEAHFYEAAADRCFAEAARLDPSEPRWPYFRGLYALKQDPPGALLFLRQAVAADHPNPNHRSALRLRLAEALLEQGHLEEAEKLFRQEWSAKPGHPRTAFGLGLIALHRGENSAAEEYLQVARASPTARQPATAQLAALARARGDEAAAARLDQEAVPRPEDTLVWPDPFAKEVARLQVGALRKEQAPVSWSSTVALPKRPPFTWSSSRSGRPSRPTLAPASISPASASMTGPCGSCVRGCSSTRTTLSLITLSP